MTLYAVGIDPGAHAGVALCRAVPGRLPECVGVWSVTGARRGLWVERMADALRAAEGDSVGPPACWVEVPVARVRKGPMAHHATGAGLGIRAGIAMGLAYTILNGTPTETTPSKDGWWGAFAGLLTIRGKTTTGGLVPAGWERVGQAGVILGADALLDAVPEGRRVDVAEAVLIAGAACLSVPR